MSPRRFPCWILAASIAAALWPTAEGAAAEQSTACSLSRVDADPASVIDPCTLIINDKDTSAADRGDALFIRGRGYHNTKRFELARQDYDKAITLTPTNEELFVSRANIAFRADQYPEGVSFLQEALALNPSNGHALRTVGALNEQSGDRDQADRYYSAALLSDPDDAYALLFRSKNNRERRKFDEALKDADALIAIPADAINRQGYLDGHGDRRDFHIVALKNRADIHQALGKLNLVEQDLTAAVTYSRSAVPLSARGEFFSYQPGREREALSDLNEAAALGPSDPWTFYSKGIVLLRLREFREALANFDQAVRIHPHFASALRMRALMHRELDETEAAVTDMTDAVAVSPTVLRETLPALRIAGYWRSGDNPTALTPALQDAIRACMLDKHCD